MTANLFFSWLQRFNAYISRDPDQKFVLLVDNCAAHGSAYTLSILSTVIVKFLPLNTTSKIQPCDAGIIAAMKVRYRMFQMERAIDLTETNMKQIYHVDILSAMLAFKNIWKNIQKSTIENCWYHTRIVLRDNVGLDDTVPNDGYTYFKK